MLLKSMTFLLCLVITPASACRYTKQAELSDVLDADAVIVGRLDRYEIIEVEVKGLGLRPSYVRLVVNVDEVVAGDVASNLGANGKLVVRSREFLYGLSGEFDGNKSFLFALRAPLYSIDSFASAINLNSDPLEFVVLQQRCSKGLIFDADGPLGTALQQVLETDGDQTAELEILEEFILEREAFSNMQSEIRRLQRENHRLRNN